MPQPEDIFRDVNCQMSQADEHLKLNRPILAAHTYARASQGLVWLYSKGILPRGAIQPSLPELAELFFVLDLRQAAAWLTVMQERREAANRGITRNGPHEAHMQAQGDQPEGDRGDPAGYSSLVDLVYSTIVHQTPPPLEHRPSLHQSAIQLYHAVKADRLADRGTMLTWININNALRVAPEDDEIRHEAELIHGRLTPWHLRWIPE